jgi:cysteine desulfurase/selenocysteine lyase
MTQTIEHIRESFPALKTKVHGKDLVYFDNAASTLKHEKVLKELDQHYYHETANIHRGVHYLSELGTDKYEKTRDVIQKFINAKERHEVLFTKGTTDGLNLVANSWGKKFLTKNDVILISTMEHHSNIVPWQLVAEQTGAIIKEIPILDDGNIDAEAYENLLKDNNVKMVSMAHCSNAMGIINPIDKFIKLAHDHGAKFCVDGAQAIAHVPVDVQALDCDFYAFSGHKIYAPTGTGVLYGKEDILNEMPPYQGGGDMIDVVTIEKTTYNHLPHKFEAGTPHIAGFIAMGEAFEFLNDVGFDDIQKHEKELLDFATKELKKVKGLKIIGDASNKSAVISFVIDGVHSHDLGTLLDQQGVAVRTGHHCTQPLMKRFGITGTTRASFTIYNTIEEVKYFTNALIKALDMLR